MANEVRQIQCKCLEMLDIVDSICRKNGIAYSLCGGSVVGAHLYGKCLAWDDDIDLMMTRENYNRFLTIIEDALPEGFSVHNYQLSDEYWSLFTKIVNDRTTVVQQDGAISGVFLDITVYDRIPEDRRVREDVFLWKISQVVSIGKQKGYSPKILLRNAALATLFRDKRRFYRYFQKRVEENGRAEKYHYSELFGAYCNTKPFAPEIFENYSEILFEGKSYMIVRDYVKYLETRYDRSDFREPKEKQFAPHYRYVDLELPYRLYSGQQIENTCRQAEETADG